MIEIMSISGFFFYRQWVEKEINLRKNSYTDLTFIWYSSLLNNEWLPG